MLERLQARLVLATQAFLDFDTPTANFTINSLAEPSLIAGSMPQYRQISMVVDNSIETTGLHPQGTSLGTTSQSMALPAGASEAVIERAWDADTGVGFALFENSRTEAVVWLNAQLPIKLGNVVPLAGYQRSDATIVVAFESNPLLHIVRYAADGSVLNAVTLDSEIYSNAQATGDGIVVLGTENAVPVAAWIDESFVVTETGLAMPAGANFAGAVGMIKANGQRFYAGSTVLSDGSSRLVFWDMQGNLVDSGIEGSWAIKSSGHALLVDTDDGYALVVRDPALASVLGIEVDKPAAAANLRAVQIRGYTTVMLTDVIDRDGESFLSVVATDAGGALLHGMVVATPRQFPSPWQNWRNPLDVNINGSVTALDALLVINRLNSTGAALLTATDLIFDESNGQPRWDVNGDGVVSAIDALQVINFLNSQSVSPEGEASDTGNLQSPWLDDGSYRRRINRESGGHRHRSFHQRFA